MDEATYEMFRQVFWGWLYVVICIKPGSSYQEWSGFFQLLGNQVAVNMYKRLADRC
jgi:hypothetical protein